MAVHNKIKTTLTHIVPYKEDGQWRFILYYEEENLETGELISARFDNVENPFPENNIDIEYNFDRTAAMRLRRDHLNIYGTMESGRYAYCTKVVIKEGKKPPKEMTVAEIEKQLGYPVKIVKEKK